jgi:hypothetical protein
LTLGLQLAAIVAATPASAQTLTYTFDPSTHFTFEDLDSAVLTGAFKVDPPGDGLFSEDIVVVGAGQEAGTYAPIASGENVIFYTDPTTSHALLLRFDLDLGAPQLQLTSVTWSNAPISTTATELGGGAQLPAPVPEASTWAMMLVGFAGLGFAAFRRKADPRGVAA